MYVMVLSNLLACILASCLQPSVASASTGTYLTLTQSLCIELVLSSSEESDCCGVLYKGMRCAFVSVRFGMRSVSCASARASCVSMRRIAAVSWERQRHVHANAALLWLCYLIWSELTEENTADVLMRLFRFVLYHLNIQSIAHHKLSFVSPRQELG